jgi:hypothetical protein
MPRTSGVRATLLCPHVLRSGLLVFKQARLLPYALCFFVFLITNNSFLIRVQAQSGNATLSGTVTDQNGALVPGVNIAVINVMQGFQRGTQSNSDGNFILTSLPATTYTVKAEHEGFQTREITNVVLNVNTQLRLNIELKVQDADATVDIVENASIVRDSPEVGTIVDRHIIENGPLNGRSFQPLLTLTPGIVLTATEVGGNEPGQFSVNGQRANANYFTVDGVSGNVSVGGGLIAGELTGGSLPALAATGGTNNLVSIDALQEFKVLTSTYAPEFGRMPGGQISIATRSGTNDFHGTLFDYFRNDLFDANDWFNNFSGQSKPATRQHDFGGVLGGPVLLPRFGEGRSPLSYNGRNKTHFFFSYEGLRLRQPQAAISSVPSLSLRAQAPAGIQPYLNAYPRPNGPENPVTRLAPFATSYSNPLRLDATSIRLDQIIRNSTTLFGRYNYAPSKSVLRGGSASLNTRTSSATTTQTLTIGGTLALSPELINELRFNYSRVTGFSFFELDNFGGATVPSDSLLFPSVAPKDNAQFSFLLAGVPNGSLIAGHLADNVQRQINIVDSVSLVRRSHSFKFGVDFRRLMPIIAPRGYFQSNAFLNAAQTLTGRSFQSQITSELFAREPIYDNISLFGQDMWKLNRRLTLTYGLRWELNPTVDERNGNDARTVTGVDSPTTIVLTPAGTPLYKTTYNNFAPRIGFAYQLRESAGAETTLRGGFGVFYDVGNGETSAAFASGAFPYSTRKTILNAVLPLSVADATPTPPGPVPSQASIVAFEPNFKLPYTLQYSFGIEQSLGMSQTLSVTYVGANGRRLLRRENFPALPQFQTVTVMRNAAISDFNSLQVQYQRRLSRGLQVLACYTFAKSLDTASNESSRFIPTSRLDPLQDRGPSDFDIRHSFSSSISYAIPMWNLGAFGNAILHDWSIDTILRASSAPPVNVTTGVSLFGVSSIARPDLILGVPLYIDDPNVPGGRRINRNAFIQVPLANGLPTRQGSLGRNSLRGFPLRQIDLTFRREIALTDRVQLQFRTDFFNLFNHPNFGSVCSSFNECAPFGQATKMYGKALGSGGLSNGFNPLYQVGGPRSTQFSLKLVF